MHSFKPAFIAILCAPIAAFAQPQAIAPAKQAPAASLSVIAPSGRFFHVRAQIFIDGDLFCSESTDPDDTQICEGPMTSGAHLFKAIIKLDDRPEATVNGTILLMPGDWVEHDPTQSPDFKYWCIAVGELSVGEMSKYDRGCHAS